MARSIFFIYLLILLPRVSAQDPIGMLNQAVEKIRATNTLSITMKTNERFGDKMREEKSHFKIQAEPLQLYFKQEYPLDGIQGLYIEGENNNEVLFASSGFPWFSFSFPPNGERMRSTHHHPITHAGLHHTADMFARLIEKYGERSPSYFRYEGLAKINEVVCHKIQFTNASFQVYDYRVKKGEDLHTIAKKLFVNDYMILELNPGLDNYLDVQEGDVIKVPSDYAGKMTIYIDKNLGVPRLVKTYDNKGLFEEFFYDNVVLDPPFNKNTFSRDNKEYGF